ncbi:hypothetical protein [Clostridium sp. C8]|jgi:hypothetical protein|uniref:hypothetical protein n=1 Tax=Clostridium sp. C8 TaxID=1667357 RepID=UPI00062E7275|nr:hypothetical protein [Clostridium sp. C8]KLE15612.1 hypothetical protein AAT22_10535 [Clostridium sp. C8]
MKKLTLGIFSLVLISLLISFGNKTSTVSKSIEEFFNKKASNEKVDILLTKDMGNEKIVLAEMNEKDGEQHTNLFLLNENNEILSCTSGRKPISQCFSVNTLIYNDKRIIFGSFNDSKYIPSEDKKVSVDISQIDITLSNNKNIRESVTLDKGYLVITDISDIKDVKILNEKDEVQSTLNDIENIVDEMDFNIYNTR